MALRFFKIISPDGEWKIRRARDPSNARYALRKTFGEHWAYATVTEISEAEFRKGMERRYNDWKRHNPDLVGTHQEYGLRLHQSFAQVPRSFTVTLSEDAPFQISRFANEITVQATKGKEAKQIVANDLSPIPPSQREALADLWREAWMNDSSVS